MKVVKKMGNSFDSLNSNCQSTIGVESSKEKEPCLIQEIYQDEPTLRSSWDPEEGPICSMLRASIGACKCIQWQLCRVYPSAM